MRPSLEIKRTESAGKYATQEQRNWSFEEARQEKSIRGEKSRGNFLDCCRLHNQTTTSTTVAISLTQQLLFYSAANATLVLAPSPPMYQYF